MNEPNKNITELNMKSSILFLYLFIASGQLASSRDCGIQRVPSSSICEFIIDGDLVKSGEFPWFVQFNFKANTSDKWDQGCSGALIKDDWVLNAQNCLLVDILGIHIEWSAFLDVTDLAISDVNKHKFDVLKVSLINENTVVLN